MPNNWYYISPRLTFQCLEDLVNYYSGKSNTTPKTTSFSVKDGQFDADFPSRSGLDVADGLCCVLTGPCLIACETPFSELTKTPEGRNLSFDWRAVNR